MRLACRNDSFPMLTHDVALDLIAALGFEGYELIFIGDRPPIALSEVRQDPAAAAARVSADVARRGLVWSDVFVIPSTEFRSLTANHPDPEQRAAARDLFRDMLVFAAGVGAPGLTMLPGLDWPGESHEESLARSATELAARVTEAHAHGLRFSVEPHMGSLLHTPDDVLRLCELAPGLELALDYGHYTAAGFSDAEIEPLLPFARHFHVRPAAPGRLQVPLRENVIDFERAIDLLAARGYDDFILVEYLWADLDSRFDQLDILSETVLLRDRLRAKLRGEQWTYPAMLEFDPAAAD